MGNFEKYYKSTGSPVIDFLNRNFRGSNLNRLTFFRLNEVYVFLMMVDLFVAADYQKCGNNKNSIDLFMKKYFSKFAMICLSKTGHFKGLLPVNRLT